MGPSTTPPNWRHLGKVIRRWRRARGIQRQQDLAAAITREVGEISHKTIQNYEQGRAPTSPGIPDGYHLVAQFFGWPPGTLEHVLAAGEPEDLERRRVDTRRLHELAEPAFDLIDAARDAGAPSDLVHRSRTAVTEVLGWMMHNTGDGYHLAASRPHAEGEGPAPDDVERILRATEDGGGDTTA